MKVESDLPNYETKADLRSPTGVASSKLSEHVDLGSLKSEIDKVDIDKLKSVPTNWSNLKSKIDMYHKKLVPVPVDLRKLNDVVKIDLVKKMYIMLR